MRYTDNKVIISLKEYDELKEYRKAYNAKSFIINDGPYTGVVYACTESEIMSMIRTERDMYKEIVDKLNNMSVWQLIKRKYR